MTKTLKIDINVGEIVKTEFDRQGRKVQWLATQLNCKRSNVYNIFKRKNIDVVMLIRLSILLNHNFLTQLAPLADIKNNYDEEMQEN